MQEPNTVICPICEGKTASPLITDRVCGVCEGTGRVLESVNKLFGLVREIVLSIDLDGSDGSQNVDESEPNSSE